jgi:putative phosphoesterase
MPRGARRLPPRCIELIAGADAVIHAGDFVASRVLEEIEALGPPVHAVHGNVDEPALRQRLPAALELELEGVRIAVVHDAGPRTGRAERLRARFPDAACAIFGHTHLPEHARAGAFHAFNPGSPTERRRAPTHSMGVLELRGGKPRFRHVALSPHA